MRDSDIEDATRRAVLKTVAGAAGIGAAGTASAHEKWQGDEGEEGPAGKDDPATVLSTARRVASSISESRMVYVS